MWTKKQIIDQSFSEIGIAPYVFDATDEQYEDALRILDSMMSRWDARGVHLRYSISENSKLDQNSNVPDWSYEAIYSNLAIAIASSYGKNVSPSTLLKAQESFNLVVYRSIKHLESPYPSTLPVGSGNRWWGYSNRFYPPNRS